MLANGFGSAVLVYLSEAGIATPVVRIGWPDRFIEHGSVGVLRKKYGLTVEATVAKILPQVKPRATASIISAA